MFSAERGTAAVSSRADILSPANTQLRPQQILNMPILNILPYSLIGSLDKLVNKGVTPMMETILNRCTLLLLEEIDSPSLKLFNSSGANLPEVYV